MTAGDDPFETLTEAIDAIRQLDNGEPIQPGSNEHTALASLVYERIKSLIDNPPLTARELERAEALLVRLSDMGNGRQRP